MEIRDDPALLDLPGTTVVRLDASSYVVVRGPYDASRPPTSLIIRPEDLVAIVLDDRLVARDGRPLLGADAGRGSAAWVGAWVGAWRDDRHDMTQHLRPDGRYSETRSGREDAWTGRYWTSGPHIVYLDDTGFWAYGQRRDGVLHHAHFVLERLG